MRKSGILLHIASLPNDYGIGSMGREAYDFVDYLKKSGQSIWQILPLSPTSYGDSPYQSFSIYAGNPYFISLDVLAEEGLLKKSEYENIKWCEDPRYIDYATMYEQFYKVMKHAYRRFSSQENTARSWMITSGFTITRCSWLSRTPTAGRRGASGKSPFAFASRLR